MPYYQQRLHDVLNTFKQKEKVVADGIEEELSAGQIALIALGGAFLAFCALACVILSSRSLVSQFDDRLQQLHTMLHEAKGSQIERIALRKNGGGRASTTGVDKRHSGASGTTLIDQIRSRQRPPARIPSSAADVEIRAVTSALLGGEDEMNVGDDKYTFDLPPPPSPKRTGPSLADALATEREAAARRARPPPRLPSRGARARAF